MPLAAMAAAAAVAVSGAATAPALAAPAGFVTASGTTLQLDGKPYRFTGINIYNANNASGCWYPMASGSTLADSLGAIAPGGGPKVIRAWFFQALATTNGARDWSGIDHTLAVAAAHGTKVIVTLGNQWPDCDGPGGGAGSYKDEAWYTGGYTQPDPAGTVSYRNWAAEIVSRYKSDPTILAWQLMNEAEVKPSQGSGSCSANAPQILKSFAADVSGLIKGIDPYHLVSLGTIGGGQCGAQGAEYQEVHDVPTIDLCEYHDYGSPSSPMPGDQWNGLKVRLDQCAALNKPLFVGESGIRPSDVGGTLAARADAFRAKFAAQLDAGVIGQLVWAWDKDGSSSSDYDVGPGDPVLGVLAAFARASEPSSNTVADLSRIQDFAISPDGARLALAATLDGIAGLYTANRDGSSVYLLASEAPGFYAVDHPDFSPNGQWLVFSAFGNPGGGDVFKVPATGGASVNLTNSNFDEEQPSYAPDGGTIVVESADAASNNVLSELRAVDSDTGAETLLLNLYPSGRGVATPAYTADGLSILFSMTDGLGQWQIASIPAAGGPVSQLTHLVNGASAFAPASSRAPSNTGQIAYFQAFSTIYTMAADGSSLAQALTDPYSIGDVHWTPGGKIAFLSTSFDSAGAHPHLHVPLDPVSAALTAGGSLSSAPATTTLVPIATTVTTPVAGTVTIDTATTDPAPSGYQLLGQRVDITAPAATPEAPLVFAFQIEASSLAASGFDAATLDVFRNGVRLPDCDAGAAGAAPDPCIGSRTTLPDGAANLTVRTSHASRWTFGSGPFPLSGPFSPVDPLPTLNVAKAGSAIPVKFSLGANQGLAVFAPGYPRSSAIPCASGAATDQVEQTTSAGSSVLQYDPRSNQYTYVWKTDKTWATAPGGPCRQLEARFVDGSILKASFKLTR